MEYPDNEFMDFRGESFRFSRTRKSSYVYTWFTPDDVAIHSKRFTPVHIDELTNKAYVIRYGEMYFLTDDCMRDNVDLIHKGVK